MPSDPSPDQTGVLTWLGCHSMSVAVNWGGKAVNEGQDGVGLQGRQGRTEGGSEGGLSHLPVFGGFIAPPRPGGDRELITYTHPSLGVKFLPPPTPPTLIPPHPCCPRHSPVKTPSLFSGMYPGRKAGYENWATTECGNNKGGRKRDRKGSPGFRSFPGLR